MPVVQVEHDPQAATDHHQYQEPGKKQRHDILTWRLPKIDMEEVAKLDDDLDDRCQRDHRDRGAHRQQRPIDDRKRDHRQGKRKSEANQIAPPINGRGKGSVVHDHKTPGR
jgi:hypothetical protein